MRAVSWLGVDPFHLLKSLDDAAVIPAVVELEQHLVGGEEEKNAARGHFSDLEDSEAEVLLGRLIISELVREVHFSSIDAVCQNRDVYLFLTDDVFVFDLDRKLSQKFLSE